MEVPALNYIILTAFGADSPDLFNRITQALAEFECNYITTRMNKIADEYVMSAVISGNWASIMKLEQHLGNLEKDLNISVFSRRTTFEKTKNEFLCYCIHLITGDRLGLLSDLMFYLSHKNVAIDEVVAGTHKNSQGMSVANLQIKINISACTHLPSFRESFMQYCDNLNLDVLLEPIREF